eukprot:gnl/TRDRNA2_/TRDRNA2_170094_c0_seq7.p1 gnl/TRDRNA2_/TRDRNA2_170094_c0~~gnl/TRDRNA2_/TRDRNA2_170094_c0_seq7.p1  ORF type:complete len:125 (-),score=7.57 gnl/TRDRNA2_/TRDRNA2_170094_c0_seq7:221-595(-)
MTRPTFFSSFCLHSTSSTFLSTRKITTCQLAVAGDMFLHIVLQILEGLTTELNSLLWYSPLSSAPTEVLPLRCSLVCFTMLDFHSELPVLLTTGCTLARTRFMVFLTHFMVFVIAGCCSPKGYT